MGQWHKNGALGDVLDWLRAGLNGSLCYECHYIRITWTSLSTKHATSTYGHSHTFSVSASASHLVRFSLSMLWTRGWISRRARLDMEKKRKITSLRGIELQSPIPYTDGIPVQNDVLAVLRIFRSIRSLFTDIKLCSLAWSDWTSVNSEMEVH
jgi:hypothetical protein